MFWRDVIITADIETASPQINRESAVIIDVHEPDISHRDPLFGDDFGVSRKRAVPAVLGDVEM